MISRVLGSDRGSMKGLTFIVGGWAIAAFSSVAYGGGHAHDGEGLWGEYGYGPHVANHRCHSCDLGHPYFTHGPGFGIPYSGPIGNFSPGYPYYGPYTGAPPFPDPLARSAVAPGTSGEAAPVTDGGRTLGIDEEPVVDADGVRGLKVVKVRARSAAEQANLQPGDVIHSINGYLTTQRGNLAWITAHAAPDKVLRLSVRGSADGKARTITARIP